MKTYIYPIVLFLLGITIMIVGRLYKILHWKGADSLIILSTIIQVMAIAWTIIKLILLKNKK